MNTALSEQLAMSAGSTFYGFAEQCIKWAKNARSIQERAAYMSMAMQWLETGARFQTFMRTKICKNEKEGPT
jgi:hypothetical protein